MCHGRADISKSRGEPGGGVLKSVAPPGKRWWAVHAPQGRGAPGPYHGGVRRRADGPIAQSRPHAADQSRETIADAQTLKVGQCHGPVFTTRMTVLDTEPTGVSGKLYADGKEVRALTGDAPPDGSR